MHVDARPPRAAAWRCRPPSPAGSPRACRPGTRRRPGDRRSMIVGAAAERADRQAAADDLAERRQVGQHALAFLHAARRRRESRSSPRRRSAARRTRACSSRSACEKAGDGQHEAHVADVRLDDDRGDLLRDCASKARATAAASLYGTTIVSRADALRDAGRIGNADRERADPAAIRNASPWP